MKIITLCSALGAASLAGCASTPTPPPELVQARAAYGSASRSPASTLALVDLYNARGDLTRAEESFAAEPGSDATRDIAYIAHRRALAVEARGYMLEADRRVETARRDGVALTSERLGVAQTALADVSAGFRGLARIPSQRFLCSVLVSPHPRPRPHKWGQGVRIHLRPVLLTLEQR
jgi:hypothetical protein